MGFRPDIIATSADGLDVYLVVEVKRSVRDLANTEHQLKHYMVGMRCPVGLIVTADRIRIYRDTFRDDSDDSVELVGDYPTGALWDDALAGAGDDENRMALAVQSWLDELSRYQTSAQASERVPQPLRAALQEQVVPALVDSDVRAGVPRWRQTA